MTPLLEEDKVVETIKRIPKRSFSILDFADAFEKKYPKDWHRLVKRFGKFGEKHRYTISTYLSNRLDVYSHKPYSILRPLIHYSEGKLKDRRRTTKEEAKRFGSPWITVYRKK